MHIKTRLDLIMDALTASNAALRYILKDVADDHRELPKVTRESIQRAKRALEKIEVAFEAVNGTEERP